MPQARLVRGRRAPAGPAVADAAGGLILDLHQADFAGLAGDLGIEVALMADDGLRQIDRDVVGPRVGSNELRILLRIARMCRRNGNNRKQRNRQRDTNRNSHVGTPHFFFGRSSVHADERPQKKGGTVQMPSSNRNEALVDGPVLSTFPCVPGPINHERRNCGKRAGRGPEMWLSRQRAEEAFERVDGRGVGDAIDPGGTEWRWKARTTASVSASNSPAASSP